MKTHIILGALVVCTALFALGEFNEASIAEVDYSRLTRKNLPSSRSIIAGCLKNMDFDDESLDSYMAKAKIAAWMPKMQLGTVWSPNKGKVYGDVIGWESAWERETLDSNGWTSEEALADFLANPGGYEFDAENTPWEGTYYDAFKPGIAGADRHDTATGYEDTWAYTMRLKWDLRNIAHNKALDNIISSTQNAETQRHFLFKEVSKRYGKLWNMLPETPSHKIPLSKLGRIEENAAVLDYMCGYLITETLLKDTTAAKAVLVDESEDNGGVEDETQQGETPAIFEVDDGLDDNVEKVDED